MPVTAPAVSQKPLRIMVSPSLGSARRVPPRGRAARASASGAGSRRDAPRRRARPPGRPDGRARLRGASRREPAPDAEARAARPRGGTRRADPREGDTMIRRGFWLTAGAVTGIYGYRRVSAVGRRLSASLTPGASVQPRVQSARTGTMRLAKQTYRFTRDVREGME